MTSAEKSKVKRRYGAVFCRLFMAAAAFALQVAPLPTAALEGLSPGMAPPSFVLPDLRGEAVSLRSFAGNPTIVIFWSTWSPRSEEILDDFSEYYTRYRGNGLKVAAVNVEGENLNAAQKTEISRYLEEKGLPFQVLFDEKLESFAAYGVMAVPSAVVLDREGRISYTLGGYPLSLRETLLDNVLKVLGLYVEPPRPVQHQGERAGGNGALQFYRLGKNLMAKGKMESAVSAFRTAVERDSTFLDPAIMIARISLAAGNLDEVSKFLDVADPAVLHRGDLRYIAGVLMLLRGNDGGAEKVFTDLAETAHGREWGLWGLGLVSLSRRDQSKAVESMKAAALLQPNNLEAESYVRNLFLPLWSRGESVSFEKEVVSLFPVLANLRDRYRNMFRYRAGND